MRPSFTWEQAQHKEQRNKERNVNSLFGHGWTSRCKDSGLDTKPVTITVITILEDCSTEVSNLIGREVLMNFLEQELGR